MIRNHSGIFWASIKKQLVTTERCGRVRCAPHLIAAAALLALLGGVGGPFAAETSPQPSRPIKSAAISRGEFESRFGKPLFTENEFARKFVSIYGVELTNFLQRPQEVAREVVQISGVRAAGLSDGSYYILVPKVFVDDVPSNSLASAVGLQAGDEILAAWMDSDDHHWMPTGDLSETWICCTMATVRVSVWWSKRSEPG